jgi:hypothetical protein
MCSIEQEKDFLYFLWKKKTTKFVVGAGGEKFWAQHLGASHLQLVRGICD